MSPESNGGIGLRCWLGFHDCEWFEYALWFRRGRCRRCGKEGWDVHDIY